MWNSFSSVSSTSSILVFMIVIFNFTALNYDYFFSSVIWLIQYYMNSGDFTLAFSIEFSSNSLFISFGHL